MFNLTQRLILGCVVLAGLTLGLVVLTHRALAAAGESGLGYVFAFASLVIAAATIYLVLWPIHSMAKDVKEDRPGQPGTPRDMEQPRRLWPDCRELNRLAVRLRELRDSEAGRRQMEFQLSDAVLQSIFEPIIVTDGKGHILKVNQAAAELLGEAATTEWR